MPVDFERKATEIKTLLRELVDRLHAATGADTATDFGKAKFESLFKVFDDLRDVICTRYPPRSLHLDMLDWPAHLTAEHQVVCVLANLLPLGGPGEVLIQTAESVERFCRRSGEGSYEEAFWLECRPLTVLENLTKLATSIDDPRVPNDPPLTIDERIKLTLLREPESWKWPQREWAEKLGCSATAVHKADAWSHIRARRDQAKDDQKSRAVSRHE